MTELPSPGVDRAVSNPMIDGSLRRVRVALAGVFAVAMAVRHFTGDTRLGLDLTLALMLVAAMVVATNVVGILDERKGSKRSSHGLTLVAGDLVLALAVMFVFDSQATPLAWVALALPILSVSVRYGLGAAAIVWVAASGFVIAFRIQSGEPGSEIDALVLGFQQLGAVVVLAIPASYLVRHLRREIALTDSERDRAHHRAERLRSVAEAARLISEANTADEVIAMTAEGALGLGFAAADVCERSATSGWRLVTTAGVARRPAAAEILSEDSVAGEGTAALTSTGGDAASQLLHHLGFVAGHALAISSDADAAVVLRAWSTPEHVTLPADLAALDLLVKQARAAWRNSRLFEMLSLQATRDTLTGLANRSSFLDALEQRLSEPRAVSENMAILFVDLDGFKEINDAMGHHVGDEVLIHIAQRFQGVAPADAVLSRFGGDEFVMLAPKHKSPDDATELARQMCEALSEPIALTAGARASVRASVGLAFAEAGVPPQDLLRRADGAMYDAKRLGGSQFVVWHDSESLAATTAEDLLPPPTTRR